MYVREYADVVVGLQYGDEGKGKITAALSATRNYSLTARYSGGANAGHTVYVDDKVVKLHQLPSSLPYKELGYIGPGALIDFNKLEEEASDFRKNMGFCPYSFLRISPMAVQVLPKHLKADQAYHHAIQGSTSSGVAPAYADFYNRTAVLANSYTWPDKNGVECISDVSNVCKLLLEGAQGFYLNPYQGNYPYTTSSSSHPAQAASNFGFSPRKFRNIIGVAKCYETRSGYDPNFHKVLNGKNLYVTPSTSQMHNQVYNDLVRVGNEYGVTTGRQRHIRFLDLNRLIKSIRRTGTNILVLQKWDVLDQVGIDSKSYYLHGNLYTSRKNMREEVRHIIMENCRDLEKIIYSQSPTNDIRWDYYL